MGIHLKRVSLKGNRDAANRDKATLKCQVEAQSDITRFHSSGKSITLTTLLFWQHTGDAEHALLPPTPTAESGEHWRPIWPVTSCTLTPISASADSSADPETELDWGRLVVSIWQSGLDLRGEEERTYVLYVVAALHGARVATVSGGRKDSESESRDSGEAGEHVV